jgi:excisionase family DNA binding protein
MRRRHARGVEIRSINRAHAGAGGPKYLISTEVATLLRCSLRTVHELTRNRAIPHRRLPGTRRCLFVENEILIWLDGASLEVRRTGDRQRPYCPHPRSE